jgi:hypothetical protein
MPTNDRTYMKKYMNEYQKTCKPITCIYCGGRYRKYNRYIHERTKKHIQSLKNDGYEKVIINPFDLLN